MGTAYRQVALIVVTLLMVPGLVLRAGGPVQAQVSDLVLDQQLIEIEGMRPVGLSPDGRWLAATDVGMRELCVYDAATAAAQSCASMEPLQSGLRLEDVVWSPDSTRLALAERGFLLLKDCDLWVMDAMSGELTNVTDDGYSGDYPLGSENTGDTFSFDVSPAWTPDGMGLTYSRSYWVDGEFRGNDIATVPATGGEPESLVMAGLEMPGVAYLGMEWTPDGKSLYYSAHSTDSDDPENGIYRYDRENGSRQQVLARTDDMGAPAVLEVSATAKHLLVWYPYAAGSFTREVPLYWLFDVESGEVTALTPPAGNEAGIGWVSAACFSPDGASLLLGTRNTRPDFQLWVAGIATGEQTRLVETLPGAMVMDYAMTPSWTASGRIFIPANIGSGTLMTVGDLPVSLVISSVGPA